MPDIVGSHDSASSAVQVLRLPIQHGVVTNQVRELRASTFGASPWSTPILHEYGLLQRPGIGRAARMP